MNAKANSAFLSVLTILISLPLVTAQAVEVVLNPSKDNTLFEESGSESNGAGDFFFAGASGGNNNGAARRAVLAFDIADAIPAGATINSVTLTLEMTRTQPGTETVRLRRLMADWGEGDSHATGQEGRGAPADNGDATWTHRFFDTQTWGTPGGVFGGVAAERSVGGVGSYSWSSPMMVTHVQDWLDNPGVNFGWILIGNESGNSTAKQFRSRENASVSTRPKLTVDYSLADADGDGVADDDDNCPNDANASQVDTDGDGDGNACDADDDGDGVDDVDDDFPLDDSETTDSDGDGVGDNADAFPNDPAETTDSDGDGVGNNADAFPQNPQETEDTDGDGMGDNFENDNGFNSSDPADAGEDADSDGFSNVQEFRAGTDPNDPDSKPNAAQPWAPLLLDDK